MVLHAQGHTGPAVVFENWHVYDDGGLVYYARKAHGDASVPDPVAVSPVSTVAADARAIAVDAVPGALELPAVAIPDYDLLRWNTDLDKALGDGAGDLGSGIYEAANAVDLDGDHIVRASDPAPGGRGIVGAETVADAGIEGRQDGVWVRSGFVGEYARMANYGRTDLFGGGRLDGWSLGHPGRC
jgi:hypothetical protein